MRSITRKARSILLRSIEWFFLCLASVVLFSCNDQETSLKRAYITFPDTRSVQPYGYRTMLCADREVEWSSSIDGVLGTGAELSILLSVGYHEISIFDDDEKCDSIYITVQPIPNEDVYRLDIQGSDPRVIIPSGTYRPAYISCDGLKTDLTLSVGDVRPKFSDFPLSSRENSGIHVSRIIRDVSFSYSGMVKPVQSFVEVSDRATRMFRFPDISGKSTGKGKEIHANRAWTSAVLDIWIDSSSSTSDEIIAEIAEIIETQILAKHRLIWGAWLDINNDGKLCILMTPDFNASNAAIGLFNTADFYALNDSIDDPDYNPNSNEMDILYIACPDDSGLQPGYSKNGILATVAHELQHLTDYSVLCSQQRDNAKPSLETEEVFLEEGLSHLAETLSGYGESGGNIAFVARYLQKTASTPLGTYFEAGYGDSVERRGGMALLLSWLYEREESASVDGGIAWIRRLYASRRRGWSRIEESVGEARQEILEEFSQYLGTQTNAEIRRDPVTGEALAIDPYAGVVSTLGTAVTLSGPARVPFVNSLTLAPYAVAFGVPFTVSTESNVRVTRGGTDNSIRLLLQKQE